MLSTGYACPNFAEFLCSWNWHILGKKMSVQSWIAPGQLLHIQGPAQKEGEVSLFPCCLRASQLHWYKGCWVLAGELISNIYQKSFVFKQANAQKINRMFLLHRLDLAIEIHSLCWEEVWVCRLNIQMCPYELSIYIPVAYSENWWSCPFLEGDWLPPPSLQ